VGIYWQQGLSGTPVPYDVGGSSAALDGYGWTSSWRATDDASSTIWNASNPDNPSQWLFSGFPSVWILETATMKIVKAEEVDGTLNVPAEVAALNI
jgi:hypothetical protein